MVTLTIPLFTGSLSLFESTVRKKWNFYEDSFTILVNPVLYWATHANTWFHLWRWGPLYHDLTWIRLWRQQWRQCSNCYSPWFSCLSKFYSSGTCISVIFTRSHCVSSSEIPLDIIRENFTQKKKYSPYLNWLFSQCSKNWKIAISFR